MHLFFAFTHFVLRAHSGLFFFAFRFRFLIGRIPENKIKSKGKENYDGLD